MEDAPARLKAVRDQLDGLGYIRVYQAAHPLELGLLRLEVWAGSRGLEMIRSLEVGPALALRFFELHPSRLEPLLEGAGDPSSRLELSEPTKPAPAISTAGFERLRIPGTGSRLCSRCAVPLDWTEFQICHACALLAGIPF